MRWSIPLFCAACLVAQTRDAAPLGWKTALDWLPADTETVVVASEAFNVPSPENDTDDPPVWTLRACSLGRLDEFSVVYKPLIGRKVQFAVAGMRAFRYFSEGLGLGPYDGCAVIKFADSLGTGLETALAGLRSEQVSGVTVYVESVERAASTRAHPEYISLFVVEAAPDMLLVATDLASLRTVIERWQHPGPRGPLLAGIPEWKLVDPTAPAWALRHYRPFSYPSDRTRIPSKPYAGKDSGAVVVYNSQPTGAVQTAYYLSHGRRAAKTALLNWRWKDEGLECKVHRKAEGVIEVNVITPSPETTSTFEVMLLLHLGFAIAM